jgi:hypothetical protein
LTAVLLPFTIVILLFFFFVEADPAEDVVGFVFGFGRVGVLEEEGCVEEEEPPSGMGGGNMQFSSLRLEQLK